MSGRLLAHGASFLGRSQSSSVDARIKDAAMRTVVEDGLAGFSVRAVCAHARVSQAEFHDRWPDAWSALLAALDEFARLPTLPDTGSLIEDLVAYTRHYLLQCDDPTYSAAFFYLLGQAQADAGVRERLAPGFTDRRRRNLTLIERAVARGELPAGVDGNAILDTVLSVGASWMGTRQMPGEPEVRRVIGQLIASARSASAAAPRRRAANAAPAGAYCLYLFEPAQGAAGRRIAEAMAIERTSETEAIAEADAQRRGRYAELWKQGHVLRIFEPD
jgi:AcrR family transcriptional regulator